MLGNPQPAISKINVDPARVTASLAAPADIASAVLERKPNILYLARCGWLPKTTGKRDLISSTFAVPTW